MSEVKRGIFQRGSDEAVTNAWKSPNSTPPAPPGCQYQLFSSYTSAKNLIQKKIRKKYNSTTFTPAMIYIKHIYPFVEILHRNQRFEMKMDMILFALFMDILLLRFYKEIKCLK